MSHLDYLRALYCIVKEDNARFKKIIHILL